MKIKNLVGAQSIVLGNLNAGQTFYFANDSIYQHIWIKVDQRKDNTITIMELATGWLDYVGSWEYVIPVGTTITIE